MMLRSRPPPLRGFARGGGLGWGQLHSGTFSTRYTGYKFNLSSHDACFA
jgi:hypothetical protein